MYEFGVHFNFYIGPRNLKHGRKEKETGVEDELVDDLKASNSEEEDGDEEEQEDLLMVGERENDNDDNLDSL